MKKINLVLVLLACLFGSLSAGAKKTVYVVDNTNMNTVYIHAWNGENDNNGGWPGQAATKTAYKYNGKDVYVYTSDKDFANVIANNGDGKGIQSDDLTFTDGMLIIMNGNKSQEVKQRGDNAPDKMYIYGQHDNTNAWNNKQYLASESKSNNTYTWKNVKVSSKLQFRLHDTHQDISHKNASDTEMTINEGTYETAYQYGSGCWTLSAGTYNITVTNLAYCIYQLKVEKAGEPVVTLPNTLYLKGWAKGSDNFDTFATLTKSSDNKYPFSFTVTGESANLMFENTGVARYSTAGGNTTVESNTTYTTTKQDANYQSSQYTFGQGSWNGEGWFEGNVFKFKAAKVGNVDPVIPGETITITGYMEGAGTPVSFTLTEGDNGHYTGDVTVTSNNFYFWFARDAQKYGSNAANVNVNLNREITTNKVNDTFHRYVLGKGDSGNFTVDAWFVNGDLKFTITKKTTPANSEGTEKGAKFGNHPPLRQK